MRTAFLLPLSRGAHPALAVISGHGASDLDRPLAAVVHYALCAAFPLPRPVVTILFLAASVVHFASDTSMLGSAALHAGVAAVGVGMGQVWARRTMTLYMVALHVPLHYARLVRARRWTGVCAALVFTGLFLGCTREKTHACFSQEAQRVVIAHVLFNLT